MRRPGVFVLVVLFLAAGLTAPAAATPGRAGPGHARYDIAVTGDGFV